MKKCSCCKQIKSYEEFGKCKTIKDGYNRYCSVCTKAKYHANKHKYKDQKKQWEIANRVKLLANKRQYTATHSNEKAIYDIEYRKANKEKIAQYKRNWAEKHKNNPIYKIKKNLRRRIHHVIKDNYKSANTFDLIGCTAEEFKKHIESQFQDGMSWDNYGQYGWHIDHIVPCHKFDLSKPDEQRKCFHYTNQRPLWWRDNLTRKRNEK